MAARFVNILALGLMLCTGMVNALLSAYHHFSWKTMEITMFASLLVQEISFYIPMDRVSPAVQNLTPLTLRKLLTSVIILAILGNII